MGMIEACGVVKRHGTLEVLRGVTLSVDRGEVAAIIGPSGGGKSTFLRCLNGLETFQGGSVAVDGLRLDPSAPRGERAAANGRVCRKLGMVFQGFNLFPHRDVVGNVTEAPVHVLGLPRAEAEARARALLDRVGLADKLRAMPGELSGGQQQRVAIARALAMAPAAMLFDEPTSALDPELVGEVLEVMRQLAASGMTMIVVTHELAFARGAADRVVMMDAGMIVEDAPSHEFFARPQHPRSQAFLRNLYQRDQLPTTDSVNATTEFAGTGKGETR